MRLPVASAALALAVVLATAVITTQLAQAQTFDTLYSFCAQTGCPDGEGPTAALIQATDGNLYGTTATGGSGIGCYVDFNCGTVFNITPSGTLATLYSFCAQSGCTDGGYSWAGLVQGTDGNFYGTTEEYGPNAVGGTVFKITTSGTMTILYSFCSQSKCTDGEAPLAALIQGIDGNFYGTTSLGGAYSGGTVFKITPTGTLTTLYSFCAKLGYYCPDGKYPLASLVQGTDGNFYGTTEEGGAAGAYGAGTVFKITPTGALTTLYTFCSNSGGNPSDCADGVHPIAGLVQGTDGNFYGTTSNGGQGSACLGGQYPDGCGTAFKMTPSGTLTTLYAFCSQVDCADGNVPFAGLIQATDGNLYGTVYRGGTTYGQGPPCGDAGCGTIFEITTGGTLTTLHSFSGPDGNVPYAALVQDTDGNLYGTTSAGGAYAAAAGGGGTVFSLSVSLGPFVKTLPTSGKVGAAVMILGTDLTGATSVSFNGTPATFTVASASLITTMVPAGATTGPVTVVTPSSGTLTSNLPFTIPAPGPTTTTLASSLNPSTYNQSVTFTATVTATGGGTPTGTVTFTADGSNVLGASALNGSGQATVSTSALTAGTHSIVASYGGDSNDQPSASTPLIQTVQMASSTLSIASNIDPSVYGQAVTFTVYVSPQFGGSATGGMTFYNSTSAIGTAGVSGNKATLTVSTLPVGTDSIQGIYSGDSNVAASASPVLFQVVNKASTTTAVTSSLNPSTFGQSLTLTATVSASRGKPTGRVTFMNGTAKLGAGTLTSGVATFTTSTLAAGTRSITAVYAGNSIFAGSTSPVLSQVVEKAASVVTLTSSQNPSILGQAVTFTATVAPQFSGTPTGNVAFRDGSTILGKVTLTGGVATYTTSSLTSGKHKITAKYGGSANFDPNSANLTQTVN
jgi:uncharacterized repeat protein (TIGR03803 family)